MLICTCLDSEENDSHLNSALGEINMNKNNLLLTVTGVLLLAAQGHAAALFNFTGSAAGGAITVYGTTQTTADISAISATQVIFTSLLANGTTYTQNFGEVFDRTSGTITVTNVGATFLGLSAGTTLLQVSSGALLTMNSTVGATSLNTTQGGTVTTVLNSVFAGALGVPSGSTFTLGGYENGNTLTSGGTNIYNYLQSSVSLSGTLVSTPEPSTYAMLGSGLILVGLLRKRFTGSAANRA